MEYNKENFTLLENLAKAIINWNGTVAPFVEEYLELQSHFELIVEKEDNIIIFSTKLKE